MSHVTSRITKQFVLAAMLTAFGGVALAQEKELYQEEPFDRMTLTKASGGVETVEPTASCKAESSTPTPNYGLVMDWRTNTMMPQARRSP